MKPLLPLLVACFLMHGLAAAAETPTVSAADRAALVDGNNAFAVDLYSKLRTRTGNLFFSPESISTALAMTYAGARGETASEMVKTLHFALPPERLHAAMGALLSGRNAPHTGYQLRVANALWAQEDVTFLPSFLKLTKSDYGAGFAPVDFKRATEATRLTINRWIEQKTEDKIKDLLPPGSLSPASSLVLTNAIYFKGDWLTQFAKGDTKAEDFHLSAAESVKAPFMHRKGGFDYYDGETFQVLEIPYKGSELSMIVLLPRETDGLPALEQSLSAANMKQWLGNLEHVPEVILTLPRFNMTQQFALQSVLVAMGMQQAFGGRADFSGMTGNHDLQISAVIHKAFIDVNEEGTEAAAATGIVIVPAMAARPPQQAVVFRADHPFLFLLRDNRSGGILFMGRVANPVS